MSISPIGFFDSGIGGISVWKEVVKLLPRENTIYLADSKNSPYGLKSISEVQDISSKNTKWLINRGCKLIVVACNTATTNSINLLRTKFEIPFVGIEPGIKPAIKESKNGKIGVLATRGTLSSKLFEETSQSIYGIDTIERHGDGIVEIIESGEFENNELESLLREYLNPMIDYGIDQLVLGCTHYFIIKDLIKKIVGNEITINDYNVAVATQVRRILDEEKIANIEKNKIYTDFFTNGNKFAIELLLGNKKSVNTI
ncbi:MAG: glutamate racemase [Cryomorphaceae bacterium]|nr:MAG: glutamate racemase [Cryomorphaceae bacterium]|tara:strand:+ start:76 stop:846 length:771 start_codon:yes stop_codon:yes gene_type:complete